MLKPVPVPRSGTEKATLMARLHNARAVMEWKLAGLSEEDARRAVVPSGTSLAGLVSHLTHAELWWFGDVILAGRFDLEAPLEAWWAGILAARAAGERQAEFRVPPADTIDDVLARYEAAAAFSDGVARSLDLTHVPDLSRSERWWEGTEPPSLRWVLVHMIGETERHAGHADLARELVDGATGYLPPFDP